MKLKEARLVKSRLSNDIEDLRAKRRRVAVVTIAPGEDFHDYINTTIDVLTQQIEAKLEEYFRISEQIQAANNKVRTNEDGTTFTIAGLVAKNIELRRELKTFKELGARNPRERSSGYSSSGDTVNVATYDISAAEQKAAELNELCAQLSARIESLDNTVDV